VPNLTFTVEGVEPLPFAAIPMLAFRLRITNTSLDEPVRSIALRCQIVIDAARRPYTDDERWNLQDLFGEPDRWGRTLRPLLWTHVNVSVPAFEDVQVTPLGVPCTFDFNVAATKYFHGVDDSDVPLTIQFSGTVFYTSSGCLQTQPVAWNQESRFPLPASVWKQMMDIYYPNSAWLRLQRDVFDRLSQYKLSHGLATYEDALAKLLSARAAQ